MSPAVRPALAFAVLGMIPARAGPPYVTDDPEPTRTGGWENHITPAETAGQAGLDFNYGAAPNLQLTLTLPEDYVSLDGTRAAFGDLSMALKRSSFLKKRSKRLLCRCRGFIRRRTPSP